MHLPPKLETLGSMLSDRGVPSAYAHRLLDELAEHHEELTLRLTTEDGLSPDAAAAEADRRLGDPNTLADAAVAAMRNTSWIGRHPIFALVLLPAMMLPTAWAVLLLAVACINGMLSPSFRVGDLSEHARTLLSLSCAACAYVIPAAASAALYHSARGRFVGRAWPWLPPLVLAIVSSFLFVRVFLDTPDAAGRLVVGIRAIPNPFMLLLPLATALLLEVSRAAGAPARPHTDRPIAP
jgi:hypothetical protein